MYLPYEAKSQSETAINEGLHGGATEVDGCLDDHQGGKEFEHPGQGDEAIAQPKVVGFADGVELQGRQGERCPQRTSRKKWADVRQREVVGNAVYEDEGRRGRRGTEKNPGKGDKTECGKPCQGFGKRRRGNLTEHVAVAIFIDHETHTVE